MKRIKFNVFIFLVFVSAQIVNGQNDVSFYNSLLRYDNQIVDINNDSIRQILAFNISKYVGGDITTKDFKSIEHEDNENLYGLGNAEIIRIEFKDHLPVLLKRNILIFINHHDRRIAIINLDHFFFIKGDIRESCNFLCGINNFRGNIQLLIFQFKENSFISIFKSDLNFSNDCTRYKYDSVKLSNSDVNNDKKDDIIITYKELKYCDKIGNEYDEPLSEEIVKKCFLFNDNGEKPNWFLSSN